MATTIETDILTQDSEAKETTIGQSFAASVQQSLQNYFAQLDGTEPANLYSMVLGQMEVPLLKMVIISLEDCFL